MSLTEVTREHLKTRQAEANAESQGFDFESEGSLATFWRQATPGTTYWRGYVPMQHLPGQVQQINPQSLSQDDDGTITLHGQQGTAIWQFLGDDGRSRIALQMQRQGVRTLMEVDDTYVRFAPPLYGKFGAWTRTHEEAVKNGTGYSVEMHRKIVPQMDGIICATDFLADEYSAWNDNVYVCRNSIDTRDWKGFERTESDLLRIGYYGSPSHVRDYPKVKKALKWAARQPGVEVSMIGFSPPGWTGKVLPWEDGVYAGRKNLGSIDVGIAPITRNPWADGKSDVKALEYAMAGVMPLLEDAPPYSPWADIGWDWMAKNESEWMDLIQDVVARRDSVKFEAAEAKRYVLQRRTIDFEIEAWREAVNG